MIKIILGVSTRVFPEMISMWNIKLRAYLCEEYCPIHWVSKRNKIWKKAEAILMQVQFFSILIYC